jgi:hypothetical protein
MRNVSEFLLFFQIVDDTQSSVLGHYGQMSVIRWEGEGVDALVW